MPLNILVIGQTNFHPKSQSSISVPDGILALLSCWFSSQHKYDPYQWIALMEGLIQTEEFKVIGYASSTYNLAHLLSFTKYISAPTPSMCCMPTTSVD